jgi:hypothetical protein
MGGARAQWRHRRQCYDGNRGANASALRIKIDFFDLIMIFELRLHRVT